MFGCIKLACLNCGATEGLSHYIHRNANEHQVGTFYLCYTCIMRLPETEYSLFTQFVQKEQENGDKSKLKKSCIPQILNETWFRAPDKQWIHSIDGWEVLCDICSEYQK